MISSNDTQRIGPISLPNVAAHFSSCIPATSSPLAEFPKGCRNERPYIFHRIALFWSNRAGVWQNVIDLA
jgi:hypothetical protein